MPKSLSNTSNFSFPVKIVTLLLNLLLGGLPSLIFFGWVERNCNLPLDKVGMNWPLIDLSNLTLPFLLFWNASLFGVFGFLHTSLAQPEAQISLQRFFPPQVIRTIFMGVTGCICFLMMSLWQKTGITIWSLPFSDSTNDLLSLILYWGFMSATVLAVFRFDALSFIGVRQIFQRSKDIGRTEGIQKLITTGIYGFVRHPIYTFTLTAFLITPTMTLDRLWLSVVSLCYLYFGIPIEEKKLVKIFGKAYLEYTKKVPAIIPKIFI